MRDLLRRLWASESGYWLIVVAVVIAGVWLLGWLVTGDPTPLNG